MWGYLTPFRVRLRKNVRLPLGILTVQSGLILGFGSDFSPSQAMETDAWSHGQKADSAGLRALRRQ